MPSSPQYTVSASFEAARQLAAQPGGHATQRLHGHSFQATLRCTVGTGLAAFPGGEVQALQARLRAATDQLDYQHLNTVLPNPSDTALAQWLHAQCAVDGPAVLELQSTLQQGVELHYASRDAAPTTRVWRRYVFQSAHRLPHVPAGHKCGNMHGHGFEAILHSTHAGGDVDATRAYAELDACWAPIQAQLHHACLNELPGLENPTSEVLSSWIWARLKPTLAALCQVTVFETASCGAVFDGHQYQIWKDFTLDSAVRLKAAPAGEPRARLHGHTYTLRLHLRAPLDQVMGWTVDFGDVKELFTPIFKTLDHQPLYQIPDLADCDTATLAAWVLDKSRRALPQVCRVDLFETRGCGASVSAA
jgi:6-pyruvoyltetrahydropterin/6-carboxytetrahydropterin synthase